MLGTGRPSASAAAPRGAGSRSSRPSSRPLPAVRRRAAPPLPGVRGPARLGVRGRLRGLRRTAARARALRHRDPPRDRLTQQARGAQPPAWLDRREADHRDGVVLGDLAVVELAQEVRHLARAVAPPGCRARSRAARARRAASPRPCRSPRRRRAGAARSGRRTSTETIIPFWYLRDLSPSRIVAVLRCERSCASTTGE